jgi:rhodanese-related sulfurtransferase
MLQREGFRVYNLKGGVLGWQNSKLPLERNVDAR